MIGAPRAASQPAGRLLTTGLPLREPMPLHEQDPAGTEPTSEGPLALDYRVWGTQIKLPAMAHPDDITYTTCVEAITYDSVCYNATVTDRTDDL